MKILSVLILCLLVPCKLFSQTDIQKKTKYVFLTEDQARANIKELISYDALKLVSVEQENRIVNFQEQIVLYEKVIKTKDTIIDKKDGIIELQDKVISSKKPIEFHTYVGVETFNLNLNALLFYGRAIFEFKKLSLGAKVNFTPTPLYDMPNAYYNIIFEYKIF